MSKPKHLEWLKNTGQTITTNEGKLIEVWEFQHQNDNEILSEWATHFRNHYCSDSKIDERRRGTGKTRSEYLIDIKFPDSKKSPGPSIRSGDFSEILVADFLEYSLNYWVPRTRYINKTIRNESTKGCDTIGFKISSLKKFSPDDEMILFEVKASLTTNNKNNRLQDAINDSEKDEIRKGESLNAIKQLLDEKNNKEIEIIERFQSFTDHPYKEISGAAAVLEMINYENNDFTKTETSKHYNKEKLSLIIIHGKDLMSLVHALYKRAADEA